MPQIVIRTLLFEGFIGLLCFFLFLIHCILTVLIFSKRINLILDSDSMKLRDII